MYFSSIKWYFNFSSWNKTSHYTSHVLKEIEMGIKLMLENGLRHKKIIL